MSQTGSDGHFPPKPSAEGQPIVLTCHCKRVSVTVPDLPKEINECQCSICYKLSAGWAYYPMEDINIQMDNTVGANGNDAGPPVRHYSWHRHYLEFGSCGNCGCTVYWRYTQSGEDMVKGRRNALKGGINMTLLGPQIYNAIPKTYGTGW